MQIKQDVREGYIEASMVADTVLYVTVPCHGRDIDTIIHYLLLAVVSTEFHPQASAATPQGSIGAGVDPNVVVPLQHAPGTTCG